MILRLERSFGVLTERGEDGGSTAGSQAHDGAGQIALKPESSRSVSASKQRTKRCKHRIGVEAYCATCDEEVAS